MAEVELVLQRTQEVAVNVAVLELNVTVLELKAWLRLMLHCLILCSRLQQQQLLLKLVLQMLLLLLELQWFLSLRHVHTLLHLFLRFLPHPQLFVLFLLHHHLRCTCNWWLTIVSQWSGMYPLGIHTPLIHRFMAWLIIFCAILILCTLPAEGWLLPWIRSTRYEAAIRGEDTKWLSHMRGPRVAACLAFAQQGEQLGQCVPGKAVHDGRLWTRVGMGMCLTQRGCRGRAKEWVTEGQEWVSTSVHGKLEQASDGEGVRESDRIRGYGWLCYQPSVCQCVSDQCASV